MSTRRVKCHNRDREREAEGNTKRQNRTRSAFVHSEQRRAHHSTATQKQTS